MSQNLGVSGLAGVDRGAKMGHLRSIALWLLWATLTAPSQLYAQVDVMALDLRSESETKEFGEIALQCPETNRNSVIVYTANRNGTLTRYSLEYLEDVPEVVSFSIAGAGEELKQIVYYDVRNLEDPGKLDSALQVMNFGNARLNEICNGSPEAKQRYRELLDSNLSILGLSPEDYPSNF